MFRRDAAMEARRMTQPVSFSFFSRLVHDKHIDTVKAISGQGEIPKVEGWVVEGYSAEEAQNVEGKARARSASSSTQVQEGKRQRAHLYLSSGFLSSAVSSPSLTSGSHL